MQDGFQMLSQFSRDTISYDRKSKSIKTTLKLKHKWFEKRDGPGSWFHLHKHTKSNMPEKMVLEEGGP